METITLWARTGEAVRQASALGERVHLETASAEWTEALLLCAIHSGLRSQWAEAFPEPRQEPESTREVMVRLAPGGALCRALCEAHKRRWATVGLGMGGLGLQGGRVGTCAGLLLAWHRRGHAPQR